MSQEFKTPNKQANAGKTALVLIQGSGPCRPGVWARSVCVNDSFEIGSMMPQIEWANQLGFPLLVMNANLIKDPVSGKEVPVCNSRKNHASYVWKHFVEPSGFKDIKLIVHSDGGLLLEHIQLEFKDTFYKQVTKIALTDVARIIKANQLNNEQKQFMKKNCLHYVASNKALGDEVRRVGEICPGVSAGTTDHKYTTGISWPLIQDQFFS